MSLAATWPRYYEDGEREYRPGGVGSIGSCTTQWEYRTNNSAMFGQTYDKFDPKRGSNIVDGLNPSQEIPGMPARSFYKPMNNQNSNNRRGYISHQDLQAVDRSTMALMGLTPKQSWLERKARVYKATTTGAAFVPFIGGFQRTEDQIPRGSNVPVSTTFDPNTPPNPVTPKIDEMQTLDPFKVQRSLESIRTGSDLQRQRTGAI